MSPAPPSGDSGVSPRCCIVAVGGGKGGIGKTMVSANIGVALALRGHSVVLVDADLGGANLHTCLGVSRPERTLSDFVDRRVDALSHVIAPVGVPGLGLISGAHDVFDAANPKHGQKVKLLRNLKTLQVDFVVLDLGAGTSFNVLDFFLIAEHGAVVTLPEPTSIENAYRFIKSAVFRKLQNLEQRLTGQESFDGGRQRPLRTPHGLIGAVRDVDPLLGERLQRELDAFTARLIINQARTPADLDVGAAMVAACRKFFGLHLDLLGTIRYDDEAWRAVRKRRPLLLERPSSEAALGLLEIVDKLLALDSRVRPTRRP